MMLLSLQCKQGIIDCSRMEVMKVVCALETWTLNKTKCSSCLTWSTAAYRKPVVIMSIYDVELENEFDRGVELISITNGPIGHGLCPAFMAYQIKYVLKIRQAEIKMQYKSHVCKLKNLFPCKHEYLSRRSSCFFPCHFERS